MSFYDDLRSRLAVWERMNPSEKDTFRDVVAANPRNAFVLKDAKEEAERWSRNVSFAFTNNLPAVQAEEVARASRNEGPADALRHCYWSALLASKLAYNDAMRVVMSHEFNEDFGKAASRMDIHNNRVGLEIGMSNKGASDVDLQVKVTEAFLHGKLVVLSKDKTKLEPTRSLQQGR